MKEFAESFYKSKTWQGARDSYIASVGGLCEKCRERGEIVAAEIVHHKVKLTAKNINDPAVTLNPKNLEALCRACHGRAHSHGRRYRVDKWGNVIV